VIAWINVGLMILTALLTAYLYVRSVQPAALEQRIGAGAYRRCALYRLASGVLMLFHSGQYVLYRFYPLPIALPQTFPWPWWVSGVIAAVIAIPAGIVWFRGMKDAGSETMIPAKEHSLYGGIYTTIRHPQAIGEMPFWWVFAFALHSPFLVIFSFIWVPIFYAMCVAEEQDLLLRYGEAYQQYRQRTGMFLPRRNSRP
jgi:protein-S-isoprenylcysteine O-methyltransferase Ste14